jgi:hypothetical protein
VTTIDMSGPFFTHDPAKTFRQNARSMMKAIAEEGESDVKAQLQAGESGRYPISNAVKPSRVSAHVVAGVPYTPQGRNVKGAPINVHVYVGNRGFSTKQGVALMAAHGWLESQVHAFRKTTNRLRRARKANAAELLKGLT